MRVKKKILLFLFLALPVTVYSKLDFNYYVDNINPDYRLDYFNYGTNNHEILFTIGFIKQAPQYFFSPRFFNFGIGELWRGKEKEFVFNFTLKDIKNAVEINILENDNIEKYTEGCGWDHTRYLYIQPGLVLIDYTKNLQYERRINWASLSCDLIYDKRNWAGHNKPKEYDYANLKFQSKLSVNFGISNIIYSDLFSKFENNIHNNNFGLEAGTDGLMGFLLNNNFFAGVTSCYRGFITKNFPFTELEYGAKAFYLLDFEDSNILFPQNLGIFIDYSRNYFNYSNEEMDFYKFQIGIQLFDFYGFKWAR